MHLCIQEVSLRFKRVDQRLRTRTSTACRDVSSERGDTVRCRLWKEIIQEPARFNRTAIENAPRPAIIAVTSVKITKPYVYTSDWIQLGVTASTYVYLNPDIPESAALKDRSHAGTSHSISTRPVPIVSSSAEKKKISELLEFARQSAAGHTFIRDASILDFITEEPWFNTQCNIGTYSLAAYWQDGSWICPAHWRITTCRYMYHITATITDSTGSAHATIYDEAGQTIVGSPCSDLITAETVCNPKSLPAAIIETKEKVFRLHLKVHLYTKIGMTAFNINRAEHIGGTSESTATQPPYGRGPRDINASLPPQTPIPTRQSHRQTATTGVKRSLPTDTGTSSSDVPPDVYGTLLD